MMDGHIFLNWVYAKDFSMWGAVFIDWKMKHTQGLYRFRSTRSFWRTFFTQRILFLGVNKGYGGAKLLNRQMPATTRASKWRINLLNSVIHCVFIVNIETFFQVNDCPRCYLYRNCDHWCHAHFTGTNIRSGSSPLSSRTQGHLPRCSGPAATSATGNSVPLPPATTTTTTASFHTARKGRTSRPTWIWHSQVS